MHRLLVVLMVLTAPAFAQATAAFGAVSGTVLDASGAPVPGAKVAVSNASLGLNRELTTTDGGIFVAPALAPAQGYKVSVNKEGFAPYATAEFEVHVGETVNLRVALAVGAVTQTVEVTGAAPVVDDVKTEMSQVVGNDMIKDLPINGRRVDGFVLLTPAVTKDADFGLVTFRGIAGGNSFLIDGIDTTNQYYNENAGRTRVGSQFSQDAVQEFQVLSSSYAAEFGRASGGVINTITKSGTNDFHGTFFWFFRNRTLDARDPTATGSAAINPPEVRHIFGGTIGGPIMKDKLFFFFDTEVQRRTFPMVDSVINSSVNQTTQSWIGCGAPATAAQCSAINALLPRMFGTVPRNGNQMLNLLKLDYRPNSRNSFTVDMNYLKWLSMNGIQTGISSTTGEGAGTNGDDSVRDRIGQASWTCIATNSMVNEFRFGWFKDRQADDFDPTLQAGYPIGNLSLSVAGFSTFGGYNILPRILPSENRYQFVDSLSWVTRPARLQVWLRHRQDRGLCQLLEQPFRHLHLFQRDHLRAGLHQPHARRQPLLQLQPDIRQPDCGYADRRSGLLCAGHLEDQRPPDRQLWPALRTRFASAADDHQSQLSADRQNSRDHQGLCAAHRPGLLAER